MPLTDVRIQDYQSLHQVKLDLGRFTVVTGATGSGKTSVFRAVRLVVCNARGTGYIRRGTKTARALLGSSDGDGLLGVPWAVGIERTASGGGTYRIATPGPDGKDPEPQVFTKLGGAVPRQVSELLALDEINFASQFDPPFLLDETGSKVAGVLGRLTGVTLIFDAARECARRRKNLAADLKRAEAERDRLHAAAQRFAGLRGRASAVESAQERLGIWQGLGVQAGSLSGLLASYRAAQAALSAIAVPAVPDATAMLAQEARVAALRALVAAHVHQSGIVSDAVSRLKTHQDAVAWHTANLAGILQRAGVCPTCGQAVH